MTIPPSGDGDNFVNNDNRIAWHSVHHSHKLNNGEGGYLSYPEARSYLNNPDNYDVLERIYTDLEEKKTGTGNADHYMQIYYYNGDDNDTFVTQKGNGNKDLRMDIRTDGGEQEIMQKGDGAHTAVINLFGSEHTDVSLTQQGNTNQSYSMTQTCQTAGGCSISVTQGN